MARCRCAGTDSGAGAVAAVDARFAEQDAEMAALQAQVQSLSNQILVENDPQNHWNTAWGAVAFGTMITPSPVATVAGVERFIANPITFSSVLGRRYRLNARIRAMQPSVGTPSPYSARLLTSGPGLLNNDTWRIVSGPYEELSTAPFFDGPGGVVTYTVKVITSQPTDLYTDQRSSYAYIEDIGPVGGAVPVEPPAPWVSGTAFVSNVSGTASCMYRKMGEVVDFYVTFTGQVLGSPVEALVPHTIIGGGGVYEIGVAAYRDISAAWHQGTVLVTDPDRFLFLVDGGIGGQLDPTHPFVWAPGDQGTAYIRYRCNP